MFDLREVFLGWVLSCGGLETGYDSYCSGSVAKMTLLNGLGYLNAMDLDTNFACLLLLFFDTEELVCR